MKLAGRVDVEPEKFREWLVDLGDLGGIERVTG
jgi:hypothetical protein